MLFLSYDPTWNPETPVTPLCPSDLEEMNNLIRDAMQSGTLVTTGALQHTGTHLKLADGKFSVTDGPFIELKELTGGFAIIQANSLEEAIEWGKRFLKIFGKGVTEIVPILGPQ